MNANKTAKYWFDKTDPRTAEKLAYIAGDYADMSDSDVLLTFVNDECGVA